MKRLHDLIAQGEHEQQDFKYKVTDAIKLARSVSAFANTNGGRLLIGVRDDGHLSGVRSEEEIYMMHAAAWKYCKPESAIKFETLHAEGRTIVIATVPPSTNRPVFALKNMEARKGGNGHGDNFLGRRTQAAAGHRRPTRLPSEPHHQDVGHQSPKSHHHHGQDGSLRAGANVFRRPPFLVSRMRQFKLTNQRIPL